ncbi:MAG TPA: DnaJ domain-containing protein [Candidatus Limnocylindria bacterium]|nr:DnaJ domain-containing protein [Candidatus Limnocylindria bacterium]
MTAGPQFDPYAVLQVVPTCEQEVVHAAFKALAMRYHPDRDGSRRAADRMAELNRAYALLRDPDGRRAFDRSRRMTVAGVSVAASASGAPTAPGTSRPATGGPGASVLSFGRYSGWSLGDLARRDPDYLLWLSRHSSGIRYRTEIYSLLRTMGVSAA